MGIEQQDKQNIKPSTFVKQMANEVAESFIKRGDLGVAIEQDGKGNLTVVREGREGTLRTVIDKDSHQ